MTEDHIVKILETFIYITLTEVDAVKVLIMLRVARFVGQREAQQALQRLGHLTSIIHCTTVTTSRLGNWTQGALSGVGKESEAFFG